MAPMTNDGSPRAAVHRHGIVQPGSLDAVQFLVCRNGSGIVTRTIAVYIGLSAVGQYRRGAVDPDAVRFQRRLKGTAIGPWARQRPCRW